MHTSPCPSRFWLAVTGLAMAVAACAGEQSPATTVAAPAAAPSPSPSPTPITRPAPAPVPTASPTALPVRPAPTPTSPVTGQRPSAATPTPSSAGLSPLGFARDPETWAKQRIAVAKRLYPYTPAGLVFLDQVRLRQKSGRPAYFGSSGFEGDIGMGQAVLPMLVHELGHAYWGAFPVTGRADVGRSPDAIFDQYHRDLQAFMRQPPDRYEPLRDRFRGMPNLMTGDYPDLYHFGEAEMLPMTGGGLRLAPPILRKYFDRYLGPGPHETYDDFIAWYLGLPDAQRPAADAYVNLAHFGLEDYEALRPQRRTEAPPDIVRLVRQEERQRLWDFARQFRAISSDKDSLVDAVEVDRGFPFWRSYLREMFDLWQRYPDVLRDADLGDGPAIASAFAAIDEVRGAPAGVVAERLVKEPFSFHFLPILPDRTIVELSRLPGGPDLIGMTSRGAQPFVEKLRQNIALADGVLQQASPDAAAGARALEALAARLLGEERKDDADEVLRILQETDFAVARRMAGLLSDGAVLSLLRVLPATTRFLLSTDQLLAALNITPAASAEQLARGVAELVRYSSGNRQIDKPALRRTHALLAERGRAEPATALRIIEQSKLYLLDLLTDEPQGAAAILASDLDKAADLALGDTTLRAPPPRVLHFVKLADPDLAARLLVVLDRRGQRQVVIDALVYHAYDADRLQANPGLRLSLGKDRQFLLAVAAQQGVDWLVEQSRAALDFYRQKAVSGEVDSDFAEAYRRTLRAMQALGPDDTLTRLEQALFSP